MFEHNLSPFVFQIGGFGIRWYSLVYIFGFLLAAYFLKKNKEKLSITDDDISNFVIYLIIGVVLGARLFHTLVVDFAFYSQNLIEILKIWHGGMSFHGGLIGAIIATYYFSRKKNISFGVLADILSIPAILALALGRLANFVNAELIGKITDASWCVNYPNVEGCRHPSQIYSSIYRFLIFFYLFIINKKEFKPGFIFWNFIFFESIGRFIVDFYREDVLYLGLTLGQILSIILVVVSIVVFIKYYRDDCKKLFGKS